jgi:hypothetical protein
MVILFNKSNGWFSMKKLSLLLFFILTMVNLLACSSVLQVTEMDAWLSAKAGNAEPTINVSGNWQDWIYGNYSIMGWGAGYFEQKGSTVSGKLGEYCIKGKVSGNKLYLVLWYQDYIGFTANLELKNDNLLFGNYFYPRDKEQMYPANMLLKRIN